MAEREAVPHRRRELLARRFPAHVTWRVRKDVWNLRSRRCFRVIEKALWAATKATFRVVHYSVMGNHVHLLVEAEDRQALSRGMQGLGVRLARRLNRVMGGRRGAVLADRYHSRVLRTPTEVKRVRHYLLTNAEHHYGLAEADPCASQVPLTPPQTYFLRRLC